MWQKNLLQTARQERRAKGLSTNSYKTHLNWIFGYGELAK